MATALEITELPNCRACRTAEGAMKLCSKCHAAYYCSKYCQRKDWPKHKAECKNSKPLLSCKVCKRQNIYVKPCKVCESVNYCSETCRKQDLGSHGPVCGISRILMEENKAREKAARYIDGHQVLPIKGLLPSYQIGIDPNPVLVVKIVKEITFLEEVAFLPSFPPLTIEKRGVLVQDAYGEKIRVCLDFSDPFPHFRWNELKAGNYLVLYEPAIVLPPPIAIMLGREETHLKVECAKDIKVVT